MKYIRTKRITINKMIKKGKSLEGILIGFNASRKGDYICVVLLQSSSIYVKAHLSTDPQNVDTYLHQILKKGQKVKLSNLRNSRYEALQVLEEPHNEPYSI